MLGAAGCGVDVNNNCGHLTKRDGEWYCLRYYIDLEVHEKTGEPIRAEVCGRMAGKMHWSGKQPYIFIDYSKILEVVV